MYEIEITNRQSQLSLPTGDIRKCAETLLAEEQVASASISLVFVDDREIQRLNRDYLQHDYATDVISFLLEERLPDRDDASPESPRGYGKYLDGEVIVSVETAIRSAEEYRWSAEQETILYVVHGLLHLVGYDDVSDDERAVMRRREQEIFHLSGMEPPGTAMDDPPEEPRLHSSPPSDREVSDS
jgi:probable rRNA maturation factor